MQNFKYENISEKKLQFNIKTGFVNVPEYAKKITERFAVTACADNFISSVNFIVPMGEDIKAWAKDNGGLDMNDRPEGYVLRLEGDNVNIYSDTSFGAVYGLMAMLRCLDGDGYFDKCCICDYPFSTLRGIKLMMPARNEINEFKEFIDMMVFFRHNTVMLEIGGAMEYKRHPEINEGWEEYAAFMSEYSGKSKKLQEFTYPWRKNSIHSNNGGGSFLLQDEIKELIAYCSERGVTIIPEVPSTSHCDYLLTRHPEIAERPEDPYPDTFCPSNPAS